ncbi:DUF559 domain-containing protein [Nocardioides sp.]|uniref:DUF559 domain-containing protein n=1 Tax=Nocardioides sp. TaxID=35761 RepID=UPI002B26D24B|nr:DUF559 domain-containing protein [Nocardioides sp.]
MSVVEELERLGGVARRSALLRRVERADLERAIAVGDIIRIGRGRYSLPGADDAVQAAVACGGVVGLVDAALHHGWAVKAVPRVPHVVVSRGRRVPSSVSAVILRAELGPAQVDGHWTAVETTLEHCLRHLPFDEALCIADSALREGVGRDVLDRLAERAKGPGSAQLRRVAAQASALAANPFESSARVIGLGVPGLSLVPQVRLPGLPYRVDLADERLRIAVECDSFEWHGKRSALERDARRYNAMVLEGWIVLRLCYHDVMHDPDAVRATLLAAVALAELLNKATRRAGPAA